MILQFESRQDYQLAAIRAVVDIFEGQPIQQEAHEVTFEEQEAGGFSYVMHGVGNRLLISHQQLLENIRKIQLRHNLPLSDQLVPSTSDSTGELFSPLNFTVEMETGTGKTYTFLRTIYELNGTYGFRKFVIVVPSVAIREGTLKNLQVTHNHFQELYSNPPIQFTVYDSSKLSALRNFATSTSIQVLVINIDSFAKDANVINTRHERGFRPIEFVKVACPIVLIDEPQNVETDIRKAAIQNLNPLCTLRYSATHRNLYNLVYSLNPVEAYERGLVKQIQVDAIHADHDPNQPFVELLGIQRGKRTVKARIAIYATTKSGFAKKEFNVSLGDNLYWLSGNRDAYLDGFILTSIRPAAQEIELSNGLIVQEKTSSNSLSEALIKRMIRRTIKHHFRKEAQYWRLSEGGRYNQVKVLTLFFVDKVANYRTYDEHGNAQPGKFAEWFEEIFEELAPSHSQAMMSIFTAPPSPDYFMGKLAHGTDLSPEEFMSRYFDKSKVHNGYFSQDKGRIKDTNGSTKADNDTYSLIMREKERLLSLDEPLRFIFSHSALREGWDNPNVFQICTLNESRSDLRKRQEIGRGLRLCVDRMGQRIFDKRINVLTVIANESYTDFCSALQKEIEEETSVTFTGRIQKYEEPVRIKLNKELSVENSPLFFEIWDRIKQKTRYSVSFSTEELIERAVESLVDPNRFPPVKRPKLEARLVNLTYTQKGINRELQETELGDTDPIRYDIPDVYTYIQSKVDITRSTICRIILGSKRHHELLINPQLFLDQVVDAIRQTLTRLMVAQVKYKPVAGMYYGLSIFEDQQIESQLSEVFEVAAEHSDKTLYNFIPIDSEVESTFARECQASEHVRFFLKMPRVFSIPTPLGGYNPDWAVVFENDARIYFVVETKSTFDYQMLREVEKLKIECGSRHFAVLKTNGVEYKLATSLRDLA